MVVLLVLEGEAHLVLGVVVFLVQEVEVQVVLQEEQEVLGEQGVQQGLREHQVVALELEEEPEQQQVVYTVAVEDLAGYTVELPLMGVSHDLDEVDAFQVLHEHAVVHYKIEELDLVVSEGVHVVQPIVVMYLVLISLLEQNFLHPLCWQNLIHKLVSDLSIDGM